MKKLLLFPVSLLLTQVIKGQQPSVILNPFPKTITVSGSAEMEVVPDEINVHITLREYQKKGENKKELETVKTDFLESCRAAGIADSMISIASFTGYNNYYALRKKKKTPDMMTSITYQVKFNNSKTMDALVEKLDDEATQSFTIVSTSHSKITEFRKQLKIKAIKAAKDKGIYLTEAINETLGDAITINEPDEPVIIQPGYYSNANLTIRGTNSISRFNQSENDLLFDKAEKEIDFKKIKLRYEVVIIFSLK